MSDTSLGYVQFETFGDSIPTNVTFDSSSVLIQKSPCQYILPAGATISTITPPSGCGIQTLTRFMLDGSVPQFALTPNPTNGDISITSSRSVGEVRVTVYNMLGVKQSATVVSLRKNTSAKFSLPSANGVYFIHLAFGLGMKDLQVVLAR